MLNRIYNFRQTAELRNDLRFLYAILLVLTIETAGRVEDDLVESGSDLAGARQESSRKSGFEGLVRKRVDVS
jgi:hypothetical protein